MRRYTGQLLKPGSKGAAVLALQKALSVPGANGYFGPATTRAVVAFQKARRLTPDGVVGPVHLEGPDQVDAFTSRVLTLSPATARLPPARASGEVWGDMPSMPPDLPLAYWWAGCWWSDQA